MGRASHSRRVTQARLRRRSSYGLPVYAASANATVSVLARVSPQPAKDLVSIDFFVVPTATPRILFVFLILEHERRRIVHFNVTEGPSAHWTSQQLVNAFSPTTRPPKYVLRDRDNIYGANFVRRVRAMGIEQVLTAPQSPWQNPYWERVIGALRRDCLDHVIVLASSGG